MKERPFLVILIVVLTILLFALIIYASQVSSQTQTLQEQVGELNQSNQQLKQKIQQSDQDKLVLLNRRKAVQQNRPDKVLPVAQQFATLFLQPFTSQSVKQLKELSTASMKEAFPQQGTDNSPSSSLKVVKQQLHYTKTAPDRAEVFVSLAITSSSHKKPIPQYLELKMEYNSTKKSWLVDDVKIQLPINDSPKGNVTG